MEPKNVLDYNRGMGGVDKMDQQLASYTLMSRYINRYKKMFCYGLDKTFNSYVLYTIYTYQRVSEYTTHRIHSRWCFYIHFVISMHVLIISLHTTHIP